MDMHSLSIHSERDWFFGELSHRCVCSRAQRIKFTCTTNSIHEQRTTRTTMTRVVNRTLISDRNRRTVRNKKNATMQERFAVTQTGPTFGSGVLGVQFVATTPHCTTTPNHTQQPKMRVLLPHRHKLMPTFVGGLISLHKMIREHTIMNRSSSVPYTNQLDIYRAVFFENVCTFYVL